MSVNEAVANLWSWLHTWLDDEGGVHGYVVHHHRDNLKFLTPDTWTQAPCILGLLRIYQKTKEKKWLVLACRLCDYLVNNYLDSVHLFRNSNHERKPLGKPGIIHNALPAFAILEVAKELEEDQRQNYCETAKDNIMNFLLRLQSRQTGALISEYHGKPAHIHNMNSAAILALIALSEIEQKDSLITDYAVPIAKHILACQVKTGNQYGAYPYVDTMPIYRTLYSLITSVGIHRLYEKTGNSELLKSVEKVINNLAPFVDGETGLICHYHRTGFPQWLPDTLLLALNVKLLENEEVEVSLDSNDVLQKILSRQYIHGSFPLSIGFADLSYTKGLPSNPSINRWRDLLPTPNWNAWNFWALAELLSPKSHIPNPSAEFPLILETSDEENEGPYQIIEDETKTIFKSGRDDKVVGIFRKKEDVASYCLIKERGDFWRTLESINKYPAWIQRFLLAIPNKIG
ncbi:MAG: hypothetical protein JSW72_09885 [Candidatus Bathyarchaeota archaeon]|nr:MAG: hypothetical protein JSW72_09885 [Candidatus Bathyarchaeota archaeon]